MRAAKQYGIGVLAGPITAVILCTILGCGLFSQEKKTDEPVFQMPTITNQYEASLDDIRFVQLQVEAVTIDMYLYLGWFPDEKDALKKASVKAIRDLEMIKVYLQQLAFTGQLREFKETNQAIIDRLIQIYDDIESKNEADIKQSFTDFNNLNSQYAGQLEIFIKKNTPVTKIPADFDPNKPGITVSDDEKGLALLSDIIDNQEYSPILDEAFYKWRIQTQVQNYGLSNMSLIPNLQYNLKRWQVINTIKQYLRTNPTDVWANAQIDLLLDLPNINRGGAFGNDSLTQWGQTYFKELP
jgi:hypothetical protein